MASRLISVIAAALFLLIGLVSQGAHAEDAQPTPVQLAWQAASKAASNGPANVTLGDQAIFHLPAGMDFIPKTEASTLMKLWGNSVDTSFLGLIVSQDDKES